MQFRSDFVEFAAMLGAVAAALARIVLQPRRFRFTSTVYHLFRVGWLAVPIMALITFLFIWVRATLPRLRYDQLMSFGWKVLLPLATLNALVTAVLVVVTH